MQNTDRVFYRDVEVLARRVPSSLESGSSGQAALPWEPEQNGGELASRLRRAMAPVAVAVAVEERPVQSFRLGHSSERRTVNKTTIYDYIKVMKKVKIAELKARLSEHLRRVRRGHSLVVLDRDTPVAKLVPHTEGDEPLTFRAPLGGMSRPLLNLVG